MSWSQLSARSSVKIRQTRRDFQETCDLLIFLKKEMPRGYKPRGVCQTLLENGLGGLRMSKYLRTRYMVLRPSNNCMLCMLPSHYTVRQLRGLSVEVHSFTTCLACTTSASLTGSLRDASRNQKKKHSGIIQNNRYVSTYVQHPPLD